MRCVPSLFVRIGRLLAILSVLVAPACSEDTTATPTADATTDTAGKDTSVGSDTAGNDTAGSDTVVAAGNLLINEVAAAGTPNDWLELYNPGDTAISLAGWTFADSITDPAKRAAFPDGASVPAKGFLQVECTDAASGFKLGKDEEAAIFAPDGSLVDSVDWADGDSPVDASFARIPNGGATWQTVTPATPGSSNGN
jgi:hypothetical protein